jgi:hypothetical protein
VQFTLRHNALRHIRANTLHCVSAIVVEVAPTAPASTAPSADVLVFADDGNDDGTCQGDDVMNEDGSVRAATTDDGGGDDDCSDDGDAEFVGDSSSSDSSGSDSDSDNGDVGDNDDDDGDEVMSESAKLNADLVSALGQLAFDNPESQRHGVVRRWCDVLQRAFKGKCSIAC